MASRRIDIHHHIAPPEYLGGLSRPGMPAGKRSALSGAGSITTMDRYGIEAAVTSVAPGASRGNEANAVALARRCNDFAAELVQRHPGRFGGFATLPLPHTDATLKELSYALDTLGLNGVLLPSNVDGIYPGHSDFAPLFEELNRRRAVVFIHPNDGPDPAYNLYVEYIHDTARAVASLSDAGYLMKFPRIRYILAHGGGSLPYVSTRVASTGIDITMGYLAVMRRYLAAFRSIRRMHFDCACVSDRLAAGSLAELSRGKRLLYGTNYTPDSEADIDVGGCAGELAKTMGVDRAAVEDAMYRTARDLFPELGMS